MGGFGSADPKASQRALLDQLMGAERDLDLESKARKKFWEKDVCKLYLAGLSPYKLLKETRGFVANGYDVWVKHAYAYALRLDCRPDDVDCERWKIDHNLKAQYDAFAFQSNGEPMRAALRPPDAMVEAIAATYAETGGLTPLDELVPGYSTESLSKAGLFDGFSNGLQAALVALCGVIGDGAQSAARVTWSGCERAQASSNR